MQNKESGKVYGGFFVRLAAFIVDSLIVGTGLLVIKVPIWFATLGTDNILKRDFIFQYSALDIVFYLLKVCYFALLTYYTGATLGKKLFHLRVIGSEEESPSFFDILFRESVGRFLSKVVLCVGYIMVGADKKKRGLHDMLSDTSVVYEHKVSIAVPTPVVVQKIPYAVQQPVTPPVQNQMRQGNLLQQPTQFFQNPVAGQQLNPSASQWQAEQQLNPSINQQTPEQQPDSPVNQQTPKQQPDSSVNQQAPEQQLDSPVNQDLRKQ